MMFTDLVSGAISDVTGKIAKATIKIRDDRQMKTEELKKKGAVTNASGKLSIVGNLASNAAEGGLKQLEDLSNKTGLGRSISDQLGLTKMGLLAKNTKYNKVFEVQFNPSSFSISASGGGYEHITDPNSRNGIRYDKVDPYMQLSVKLLFDRAEDNTAFPISTTQNNVATAVGSTLRGVVGAVNTIADRSAISVETAVEGFIGAVRGRYTKHVCFEWGPMSYEGLCKSVSANYTMFDSLGRPVRATVDLTIYLYDKDVVKLGSQYDMGYWKRVYQKVFKQDGEKFGTISQSLMNLNPFGYR